jgi:hypothetical protein
MCPGISDDRYAAASVGTNLRVASGDIVDRRWRPDKIVLWPLSLTEDRKSRVLLATRLFFRTDDVDLPGGSADEA